MPLPPHLYYIDAHTSLIVLDITIYLSYVYRKNAPQPPTMEPSAHMKLYSNNTLDADSL